MSHAPTEKADINPDHPYHVGWDALGKMIRYQGMSFSGRERNCCFLNTRGTRFANVSAATGLDLIDDSRGVALVDWDHDGDQDLWITNRTGPRVRLMRNDVDAGHNYLAVRLQGNGVTCNRDAIGARLELHFQDETGSPQKMIKTLRAGEGFLSQSSKWMYFGLGTTHDVEKLVIRWPGDGSVETFRDFAINRRYNVIQGSGRAAAAPMRAQAPKLQPSSPQAPPLSREARVVLLDRPDLPPLEYDDFQGRRQQINEVRQPRLINLWASWCQPCVEELRQFQQHLGQFEDANLNVIALSTDGLGDAGSGKTEVERDVQPAKELAKRLGLRFTTGVASEAVADELAKLSKLSVDRQLDPPLPVSFLVDQNHKVAVIYNGPVTVEQVLRDVQLLDAPRSQLELAAFPFPGRGALAHLPTSRHAKALAYYEAGYHDDAVRVLLTYLHNVKKNNELVPPRQLGQAYFLLATIFEEQGKPDDAVAAYQHAVGHLANQPHAVTALAMCLSLNGRFAEADALLRDLLSRGEKNPAVVHAVAQARMKLGEADAAIEKYQHYLQDTGGENEFVRFHLAATLKTAGKPELAVEHYQKLLESRVFSLNARNNLAWILATSENEVLRDGDRAVQLAEDVCDATNRQSATGLDTLAAAYAEVGRFEEAVAVATQAGQIARGTGEATLADDISARLAQFESKLPHREGKGNSVKSQ